MRHRLAHLALRCQAAAVIILAAGCAHPRAATGPAPVPAGAARDDREADVLRAKFLMVPVAGIDPAKVRDTYTARRGTEIHAALDILAPRGTPVLAADDGRIFRLRHNEAGGITVYQLDAGEQFVYYYAHLDHYRDGLREGMTVRQGDVIGYVGTTGNAPPDTPHLHFQLMRYVGHGQWWGGEPVDPAPYLVRPGQAR